MCKSVCIRVRVCACVCVFTYWFEKVTSLYLCTKRLVKSKGMVAGIGANTPVLFPVTVEGGAVDMVEKFH